MAIGVITSELMRCFLDRAVLAGSIPTSPLLEVTGLLGTAGQQWILIQSAATHAACSCATRWMRLGSLHRLEGEGRH